MNGAVWIQEWRVTLRRRRLLALNVSIPLILVLPISLGGAPAAHAAAVYTVLFVLFGTFGSTIPLIRDGESGFLGRIRGTGLDDRWHLVQRTAAAALIDTGELLPALAVLTVAEAGAGPEALAAGAALLPILALSLLVANAVGAWVAAAARSLAEAALFAAVVALLLLHGSGVFRTPTAGGPGAAVERWAPFRALHEGFVGVAWRSGAVPGAASLSASLHLLGATAALLAMTGLIAPWILDHVEGPSEG